MFEAVEKGFCAYGILPVENSAAGSVTAVYDLMERQRFHIVRALRLKVDHVLLGARGARLEDVREITSHPHALAQCRAFLRSLPKVKATPGPNTAVAAKELAESGRRDLAVVASRACAELYGLDVIKDDIMDAAYNYTRFVCISKDPEIWPDARKFTVTMRLPHRPGALNTVILKFASIGVNLTKLESRPIPGTDFEFRFIFDFEASPGWSMLAFALKNPIRAATSSRVRRVASSHWDSRALKLVVFSSIHPALVALKAISPLIVCTSSSPWMSVSCRETSPDVVSMFAASSPQVSSSTSPDFVPRRSPPPVVFASFTSPLAVWTAHSPANETVRSVWRD